jgi:hypothetical protein
MIHHDKSGVGHLERMKLGSGIKVRDDKPRGIEILMVETFSKINPTDFGKSFEHVEIIDD